MVTVVAVGVGAGGWRHVLGCEVGPSEDHAFWTAFLRSLVRRGLRGVPLEGVGGVQVATVLGREVHVGKDVLGRL